MTARRAMDLQQLMWQVKDQIDAGGTQGPKGDKGDPGVGIDGEAGADGLSAYQVAVVNGFVGTEADWLLSLKGEPGEQGEPGADGSGGQAFPVGSVFIAVVNTNPGTLLGYGTWVAFGAGRMMIGHNAADTDFDTAEESGGAKTSTALIAHTHLQDAHTHVQNAHTHQFLPRSGTSGAVSSIVTGTLDTSSSIGGADQPHIQAATAVNQNATAVNQSAGSGASFSLMNPYIVAYFWKRTA
jgi:hypothetical protein